MTIQQFLRTLYGGVMVTALAVPVPLTAQQQGKPRAEEHFARYTVKDLGTLGGPYSFTYSLNDAGVVTGGAATGAQNGDPTQAVNNAPQTAFAWEHGRLYNLGTLGGPNSAGAATNLFKVSALDSETPNLSRPGEDVCGFGTNLQCRAAIRKADRLTALPLLPGGNNSYALDLNDLGETVGYGDTDVYDVKCAAARTAGFRFEAVTWERNGKVRQLTPLDAENGVAWAFGINDRGQVVGSSGVCGDATPPPYVTASHAVLWKRDGTPVDLGSLGGGGAAASAINNRGDISGTSLTAEGSPRPFLWTPESRRMVQLNPPTGFPVVVNPCCKTINDRREIVGFMLDSSFNSHAFLWRNGVMVDLNTLISEGSGWQLQSAAGINDSGQIAGQGLINGEVHAFLASPCPRHGEHDNSCENDRR